LPNVLGHYGVGILELVELRIGDAEQVCALCIEHPLRAESDESIDRSLILFQLKFSQGDGIAVRQAIRNFRLD